MRRLVVVAVTGVLTVLVVTGLVLVVLLRGGDAPAGNPFEDALPAVDPGSTAAQAAAAASPVDRPILERLAAVPTAVWLVPEALGVDAVGARVEEVVETARSQDRRPLLVVYGIPGRDCVAGESAGGLGDVAGYEAWVDAIAASAGGSAVVLEPDALATADECGLAEQRQALLRRAADVLAENGAWVYVDAGHSDWVDPVRMAELVEGVGPEHLRGFSVNVAAYGTDDDERAYAEAVRAALDGSLAYVVDTSRNGNGPAGPGDFCNPQGRALGREPAPGSGGLDAWLWVKPPGESDGSCGGGPPAGQFWVAGALDLAAAAGWR